MPLSKCDSTIFNMGISLIYMGEFLICGGQATMQRMLKLRSPAPSLFNIELGASSNLTTEYLCSLEHIPPINIAVLQFTAGFDRSTIKNI